MKGFRFARFVEEYTKRSIHLNFKMLTLPQLPHQQDPEQRQSVPGVDQPFVGRAEQIVSFQIGTGQNLTPAFCFST